MDTNGTPTQGITRRSLLRSAAFAAGGVGATALLAGCGSAVAAGVGGGSLDPQTVTFWNLFGGGDGARLTVMLDAYKKQYGKSSLTAATFAWGDPYYTKLTLATLGHKAPDVAISHLTRMQNLAQAGLLTEITDQMLSSVGLAQSDLNPVALKNSKRDGKLYAIPLDTHPFVLFYNIDVCKKAGLIGADGKLKPIKGIAQWEAALTAAKKATGKYAIGVSNVGDFATSWRMFQTFYSQINGATPYLGDSGKKITVDDAAATKAMTYIKRMSDQGWIPKAADYGGAESMMFTGQAAFYLEGEWELTTAQAVKGLKFGMAPVPQLFDRPAAQADSHTFVLPKLDRSPARLKRDMNFIAFMLKQSMTWAAGGHVPAYLPIKNSAAYKKLEPQADYASAANHAYYDALAWYSGSGSAFENIAGSAVGLVQQGLAGPTAALSSIRSQLQPYLTAANPL